MTASEQLERPDRGEPPGAARLVRGEPRFISVIVPAYNESGNVQALADAVAGALKGRAYELIFVDDGSRDDTFERIAALVDRDPAVVGVSFSRNFGHQHALAAGLQFARGDVVVMMDADMQHPPSLLPTMIDKWREGFNVVQTLRQDDAAARTPWLKRVTSRAYYRLFSALCGVPIEPGMADFRLVDRIVADELKAMCDEDLFLRGLFAWMGYRQAVLPFAVAPRHSGRTKYTARKMLALAKAGLLSMSPAPPRIASWSGLAAAAVGVVMLLGALVAHSWAPAAAGGVAIMFGLVLVLIGVQGEYILRIHDRIRRRPPYLIERVIRRDGADGPGPAGRERGL